ncbi:MAG: 3-phosphoserine/phosphohydroxythreonine transaminase [Bacteroidales bacterium]|jgi:phosphoserine aminotransferase|nr:3-phosphoserine/phosphohydroxythreonine transaminase [Bacteroidales bacterium]
MRKHIFNAGPCKLPMPALENTAKAVLDLNGIGQSIMEVSHRGKDFEAILDETIVLMKELLSIPEGYRVLFLGGGASSQFAMIPMNFLKTKAYYLNTGTWSTKALEEAVMYGTDKAIEIATSKDKGFTYIPKGYEMPKEGDYFHITTNNTIRGTEIHEDYTCNIPLIADMSSDFMSRPVDVSKYAMIYGGAQKNLGPAGVTFAIIKDTLIEQAATDRLIPTMMRYSIHAKNNSMYNTPPCINIFVVCEVLKWLKDFGGLSEMYKYNKAKAEKLYNAIDESKMFRGPVVKEDRSLMNIVFLLEDQYKEKEADFVKFCGEHNIVGIKGHRSVGGFRASTYNACSLEDVDALVKAMQEFEVKNL